MTTHLTDDVDPDRLRLDGAGMTTEERDAWRDRQARRLASLPAPGRRRTEPAPTHVQDPAALGLELQARCLRNAQEGTR